MPSLSGATEWINSEPLGPAELRGHVVIVDFWTLTCINRLRTEPYIRTWSHAYREDGLPVIGVHTPEFSFEHEVELVRQATEQRGIDYPVVVDNDYRVWNAFDNHYWPALYFVDREGVIRDHHFGEGHYEQSERVIQRLLGVGRELVSVEGVGVEAAADWDVLGSPETYVGYARADNFSSPEEVLPDQRRLYTAPTRLGLNHWALSGDWTVGREAVRLNDAEGAVECGFRARDLHLVLTSASRAGAHFRVLIDGRPPGDAHGVDVDEAGNGVVTDSRLYQLIRQREPITDRRFQITFLEPGVAVYVFTFG
jgi:thiol-disulfide isomerase/thioredoxin